MSVSDRAREVHRSDWVDGIARAGLVPYGVVYVLVGWLAVQLAFGDRQGAPSSQGALRQLAQEPFGNVLVWVVAIGMFLLVAWQLIEACFGHRDAEGKKRTGERLLSVGRAVVYGAIGVLAVEVAVGSGSSGGSGSSSGEETLTAKLMNLPAGQWIVGAVGVGIAAVGVAQLYRAWSGKLNEELDPEGRSGASGTAYLTFGKIGYTARGVAFAMVGALFGYAAATHDAQKSGGLDQALSALLKQPAGPVLLCLIGVGLGCFGLFTFAEARHLSR